MKVTFYQLYGCPNNKIYKDNYLFNAIDVDGVMRQSLDRENPILLINTLSLEGGVVDSDNIDVVDSDSLDVYTFELVLKSNYCYIHEMKRYYFIESVAMDNNQLTRIELREDVLSSFKDGLLNQQLFITRREYGNPMLKDDMIQYEYVPSITKSTSEIHQFVDFSTLLDTTRNNDDKYCVVVCTLGIPYEDIFSEYGLWYEGDTKNTKNGDIPYASINSNYGNYNSRFALITPRMLTKIFNLLYMYEEVKSFIRSIIILPYEPEKYLIDENRGISHKINFGERTADFGDDLVYEVKYGNNDVIKAYRIIINEGTSYEDYEPFTNISLYLPFATTFALDRKSASGYLYVYYYTNYTNNQSSVWIYNASTKMMIGTSEAHLGVSIPLDSTNAFYKNLKDSQIGANFALGSLQNVINLAMGIGSGNGTQVGQSIVSEFSDASNAYFQSMNNKQIASVSTLDSNSASFMPLNPYLEWHKLKPTIEDKEGFYIDFGQPYYQFSSLNYIHTNEYFKVGDTTNIHLQQGMTNIELDSLKLILAQGVYK